MLYKWKEKYFHISRYNFYFGLLTGIVVCLFCMFHVYTKQTELYLVIAAFAAFVIALLCSNVFHFTIQKKIKYSFWLCLLASITTGLGSYLQFNIFFVTIGIVVLMILLALSTLGGTGFFTVLLLSSSLFIIGTGFSADNIMSAFYNALSFFLGSGIIFSLLIGSAFLKRKKLHLKETFKLPHFQPLTSSVIIYAFQLISAVLITYYISQYLNFPDGYWLPMTALLVLKIDQFDSFQRIKHRFLGTVLGSLVSIPISFISDKYVLSLFMIPILLFVVLGASKHYGSFTLFLTAMISIIMNIASNKGIFILFYRNLDTCFAVLCVAIILLLTKFIRFLIMARKSKRVKKL